MLTGHIVPRYQSDTPMVTLHETEAPGFEARMAMVLVEKWGMVAGVPDGEDSSGRSKLRLMTPAEVVERACSAAETLAKAVRDRGWMTILPTWEEAEKLAKGARHKVEDVASAK